MTTPIPEVPADQVEAFEASIAEHASTTGHAAETLKVRRLNNEIGWRYEWYCPADEQRFVLEGTH